MSITQKTRIINRYGNRADLKQLATGEFGFAVDTGELFIGAPNLTSMNSGNIKIVTETDNDYLYTSLQSMSLNDTSYFTYPTPLYTINSYNFTSYGSLNENGSLYESPNLPIISTINYKLMFGDYLIESGKVDIISTGFFNQTSVQYYDKTVNDLLNLGTNTPSITKNEEIGYFLFNTSKFIDSGSNLMCPVPTIQNSTNNVNYYDNAKNVITYNKTYSYVQFLVSVYQSEITMNDGTTELNTSIKYYGTVNLENESSNNAFKLYYKINGEIT